MPSKAGEGFGKTTHQGYHRGYSEAATAAMAVAARFKKSGLSGCAKLKAIQGVLKKQLETGSLTMYGNQHPSGVDGVQSDWERSIRDGIRRM
ncbi:hypothetical protein KPB01_38395 [Burkholderia sola]|nr:hypothetical protein [Burkholderia sola]